MKLPGFKSTLIKSIVFLFLIVYNSSNAQIVIPLNENINPADRDWMISDLLDSIANKAKLNSGIICLNANSITIDTVILSKVKHVDSDSVVVGKFLKKNQKKISSKEFWGVITVSGECRRFYRQDMYQVWETPSPYIYRLEKNTNATYFFSETLISPLSSLDRASINNSALSPQAQEILHNVLDDRQRAEELRVQNNKEVIANISVNLISVILQIMVSGGGHGSHSSGDYGAKKQTGPRK